MKIETPIKYFDDINGKLIEETDEFDTTPSATISFNFGYGSTLDGVERTFHLNQEHAEELFYDFLGKYPHLRNNI